MNLVRTPKRAISVLALALLAVSASLTLSAGPASAASCPSFKVLHDDRIGVAILPAGNYLITADAGLSCQTASQLFARFLEDYDGVLPKPWRLSATSAGKASFSRGAQAGFSVSRESGGGTSGGGGGELGRLCSGNFTVNAGSQVGPLSFPKGLYLLYVPPRSGITCRRASILFIRFLGAPGGALPQPWQVKTQIATFFKPSHPIRSAFRVEPLAGAGPAE